MLTFTDLKRIISQATKKLSYKIRFTNTLLMFDQFTIEYRHYV